VRDLNCDMGELPEMLANGSQEALMKFVTSANVACGGHAGDEDMMQATIEQAMRRGVAVARIRAMRTGRISGEWSCNSPRRKFGIPSTGS